jgi:predicted glycogen debranching enzyme
MSSSSDNRAEWLEADGLGGFASGTVSGIRTRRYHALLLVARKPPTERFVLVNGFDAWVNTPNGTYAISSQVYGPGAGHPDGASRLASFNTDPWPQWTFELEDGTRVRQELFARGGAAVTVLSWRQLDPRGGVTLSLRPFVSGRDYHSMHHENSAFDFTPRQNNGCVVWQPYDGLPAIAALTNGDYEQQPDWYRNFFYEEERARGLDDTEDLASPGIFHWNLSRGEALLILSAEGYEHDSFPAGRPAEECLEILRESERKRRKKFKSGLERAADAYMVRRGEGKTIVAGYPWFADWGRDTFIALRGLYLATERFEDAREILLQWASAVSEGMLPNRFPDSGETPEFNSVDASLWYVIAVYDYLRLMQAKGRKLRAQDRNSLEAAVQAIVKGYAQGTRYGIRLDGDGLLAAGAPGLQLTWMDSKIGDWVVTPRIGKPVEVEALWLNALRIVNELAGGWSEVYKRGMNAFRNRFWNPFGNGLYDVVDVDQQAGAVDGACRPNQIFAVGGLPFALLDGEQARRVVQTVGERLLTPAGLRSLAPGEPGYRTRYEGGVWDRDSSYHQGTVWPWLIGPFVEAWVRVRGETRDAKEEARARFVAPFLDHLDHAGLGHVSEIADADPPHTPRGCPFQAWSLGELIRLQRHVLA